MMMMRESLSKAHLCYESDVLQVPSPHVHDGDCRLANNVDEDDCQQCGSIVIQEKVS
jgi:hypothetical protein